MQGLKFSESEITQLVRDGTFEIDRQIVKDHRLNLGDEIRVNISVDDYLIPLKTRVLQRHEVGIPYSVRQGLGGLDEGDKIAVIYPELESEVDEDELDKQTEMWLKKLTSEEEEEA